MTLECAKNVYIRPQDRALKFGESSSRYWKPKRLNYRSSRTEGHLISWSRRVAQYESPNWDKINEGEHLILTRLYSKSLDNASASGTSLDTNNKWERASEIMWQTFVCKTHLITSCPCASVVGKTCNDRLWFFQYKILIRTNRKKHLSFVFFIGMTCICSSMTLGNGAMAGHLHKKYFVSPNIEGGVR